MRVLIVEDEPLAQEELARLISNNFAEMEIVAMLGSVEDSVEWLKESRVDLIFMDIHLSDGVSFDIFDRVEIDTPIIFITAYDQYAIKAFQVNGVGYILKPLNEQKLVETVTKFRKHKYASAELLSAINEIRSTKEYKVRIAIKLGDVISSVNIADVAYFFAEDRVTFVVLKSGKKHIVDYSIESLETMLDPLSFFRLTRGCLASIDSIEKVSKYFNSRLKVTLSPEYEKEILVSRMKTQELIRWLGGE